jgi:hypothetical protein
MLVGGVEEVVQNVGAKPSAKSFSGLTFLALIGHLRSQWGNYKNLFAPPV